MKTNRFNLLLILVLVTSCSSVQLALTHADPPTSRHNDIGVWEEVIYSKNTISATIHNFPRIESKSTKTFERVDKNSNLWVMKSLSISSFNKSSLRIKKKKGDYIPELLNRSDKEFDIQVYGKPEIHKKMNRGLLFKTDTFALARSFCTFFLAPFSEIRPHVLAEYPILEFRSDLPFENQPYELPFLGNALFPRNGFYLKAVGDSLIFFDSDMVEIKMCAW
ncbi:MAG: hypothetical protein ACPGWM_02860 [Flavobacteriales bacterium]